MPKALEGGIQKCWENIKNSKLVGAPINNQVAVVAFAQSQQNKKRAFEVDGGTIGWYHGLSRGWVEEFREVYGADVESYRYLATELREDSDKTARRD